MKKIFGKNQVIITALAIMIAVAGYLSVTQENADNAAKLANTDMEAAGEDTTENAGEDATDGVKQAAKETIYDISDEDMAKDEGYTLTDNGEIVKEDVKDAEKSGADNGTDTDDNTGKNADADTAEVAANDNNANVGEAVLVSSTIGTEYFDQAKLSREQTRSKNKEILMELVNSTTTTKEQKEKAVNEVVSMTADSEKETATENMLEAKGYGNSIVSIVDGSVDVIVNANSLSEKDIAQIEDIVKRKTSVEASNIVITPVGVK